MAKNRSAATYRYAARVILRGSAEQIAARHPFTEGQLEPIDESTCLYVTSDDSLEWLALRIGFLGVEFEVQEPPELVEWCRALARRFADAAP